MDIKNRQGGLIKIILIIVITLFILSYLGINLRKIADSETGKENFSYVWELLKVTWGYIVSFWNNYLANIWSWIWNNMVLDYIWPRFQAGFEMLKSGETPKIGIN